MPRLPFQVVRPKAATSKPKDEKPVVIDATGALLPYDSTKVYIHLGAALRASESAQIGLMRLAQALADTLETKELEESALAERLRTIAVDLDDFEKTFLKFQRKEIEKIAHTVSAALAQTRAAMGWFQKFCENHSEEDALEYRPILARLQNVTQELMALRKKKIENTAAMEEALEGRRQSQVRKANATRPVTRKNQPYPATEAPEVALDPHELARSLELEITQREQDSELKDSK